jgi:hypothetical protein
MRSRRPLPLAVAAIPAAAVLAAAGCAWMRPVAKVGTLQEQEFTVEREGAVDANVRVSFWGGSLRVRPGDSARLARLRTRDNLDALEPHADTRRDKDHLSAGFWLDSNANVVNFKSWSGERSRAVRDSEHDVVNEWDLDLARSLPLTLELDLSTCDADVELGGLALRSATLDLGGGTAVVSFERPHPDRLERLALAVGAGRLVTRSLGNSHARAISVHAGAGSCVIDLAGDWRADALVTVDAGACRVEIRVPRDLAVRANLHQTLFSGLSAPEFESLGDHGYASPAFAKGGISVVVDVSASLGEVHLVLD